MTETTDLATSDIDDALADLRRGEQGWAQTPLRERREILDECSVLVGRHATEWVETALRIKGLAPGAPQAGEEWMSGPYATLEALHALSETLGTLAAGHSPLDGASLGAAPGGRVTVPAYPRNIFDRLLLNGYRADVWLRPGVDAATARAKAGLAQRRPTVTNGIGAVLGAGNVFSIAPLDTLYELLANNRVVILKLNPITDPLLPVFLKAFAPLIRRDLLRIVTGGAEAGGYLVRHPGVAHVHMTGSALTHDAIVFGGGAAGAARKAAGEPLLDKPITSELGGVSPTIIVPGTWSAADLQFHAANVATQRLHNGGYNCIAAQALIISADWPQKDEFLRELRAAIDDAPPRKAYYPGSDSRIAAALESYPDARRLGPGGSRLLIEGVTAGSALTQTEYFAPVLGVTELSGTGAQFLRAAVAFANDELTGTLGANVLAHPGTIRELGASFSAAIEDLRYGAVAINAWTALAFLSPRATWGAYPGHTLDDVQSGIGIVHNGFLLDDVEKTVVRGPFRPLLRSLTTEPTLSPNPPWFVNNRTAPTTGRRLTEFSAAPGWVKLPALFASALRG